MPPVLLLELARARDDFFTVGGLEGPLWFDLNPGISLRLATGNIVLQIV